jgi:hypothetical protein
MRQFLFSEISMAYGIPNMPDDPDLAIETGRNLCDHILEPLTEKFGPLIIRSGYRSSRLNAFGASKGLKCASNTSNFARHIWDRRDDNGYKGATACIVIPSFLDGETEQKTWQELAYWIDANLPYHSMTFFKADYAFNIGFHERPRKEIFSRIGKPHWLKREGELDLKSG